MVQNLVCTSSHQSSGTLHISATPACECGREFCLPLATCTIMHSPCISLQHPHVYEGKSNWFSTIGRTWCGMSCEHLYPSHQAPCTSLQDPYVRVGGESIYIGRLHTHCTLSCGMSESVLKCSVSRGFTGANCVAGTTRSSRSTCRTVTSTLGSGARAGRPSSTVTSAQT